MAPPRKRQTYEERAADEDGTPLERFQRLVKHVVSVPKAEIDKRERDAESGPSEG